MFRNPRTQPNGLEKVYTGEFEQDPSSDFLIDIVEKINHNVEVGDAALGELTQLKAKMAVIAGRGLLDGYLNGGVCGERAASGGEETLTITKMFVTPIEFPGTDPALPPVDLDPLPVDLDPLPPPPPPEAPYCPGIRLQGLYTDPAVVLPPVDESDVLEVLTDDEDTIL